jgi:hypothetical protein
MKTSVPDLPAERPLQQRPLPPQRMGIGLLTPERQRQPELQQPHRARAGAPMGTAEAGGGGGGGGGGSGGDSGGGSMVISPIPAPLIWSFDHTRRISYVSMVISPDQKQNNGRLTILGGGGSGGGSERAPVAFGGRPPKPPAPHNQARTMGPAPAPPPREVQYDTVVGRCRLKRDESHVESVWFRRVTRQCDVTLSKFAFNFNLRHYTVDYWSAPPSDLMRSEHYHTGLDSVGRCRSTLSNPL